MIVEPFLESARNDRGPVGEKPKPVGRIEGDAKKVEKELDTGISEGRRHQVRALAGASPMNRRRMK
jgi:hypothetical protein